MHTRMHPYQFSAFELDLMSRLQKKFIRYNLFEFRRWPRIYWGNREESDLPKQHDIIFDEKYDIPYDRRCQIDLLGVYRIRNYIEEGYIELYSDLISESAEHISNILKLNYTKTYEILRIIVLLHELGHWFTHSCCRKQFLFWGAAYQELSADKNVTETMAQLAVKWACYKNAAADIKTIELIMDFLAEKQPRPYWLYKKLGGNYSKISTIQKRYIELVLQFNVDVDYLLLIKSKL